MQKISKVFFFFFLEITNVLLLEVYVQKERKKKTLFNESAFQYNGAKRRIESDRK